MQLDPADDYYLPGSSQREIDIGICLGSCRHTASQKGFLKKVGEIYSIFSKYLKLYRLLSIFDLSGSVYNIPFVFLCSQHGLARTTRSDSHIIIGLILRN